MPRVSESNIRLRVYMRLAAVGSANLAADVTRIKKMAEAYLSARSLAAVTKAKVNDGRAKKVTAQTRAEVAAFDGYKTNAMTSSGGRFAYHTEFLALRERVNAWWIDGLIQEVILDPVRREIALALRTQARPKLDST
jgi:hypothetical protein